MKAEIDVLFKKKPINDVSIQNKNLLDKKATESFKNI